MAKKIALTLVGATVGLVLSGLTTRYFELQGAQALVTVGTGVLFGGALAHAIARKKHTDDSDERHPIRSFFLWLFSFILRFFIH